MKCKTYLNVDFCFDLANKFEQSIKTMRLQTDLIFPMEDTYVY